METVGLVLGVTAYLLVIGLFVYAWYVAGGKKL